VSSDRELTVEDHLHLADELLALAAWGAAARPDDGLAVGWAVTQVFYAAVHGLSACVLARHGVRAPAHQDRGRWFNEYPELRKGEAWDYRALKQASEGSRYRGVPYTAAQYAAHRTTAERLIAHWAAMARKGR
jgi:hypothetical protein